MAVLDADDAEEDAEHDGNHDLPPLHAEPDRHDNDGEHGRQRHARAPHLDRRDLRRNMQTCKHAAANTGGGAMPANGICGACVRAVCRVFD